MGVGTRYSGGVLKSGAVQGPSISCACHLLFLNVRVQMLLGHHILLVLLSQGPLILLFFSPHVSFLNLKCRSAQRSVLRPPSPLLSTLTPYLIPPTFIVFNYPVCASKAHIFISGHNFEFQTHILD